MKKKILVVVSCFTILGVLSRTVFHLGPNIEFITAIAITSGFIIKNKKLALLVPIFTMFLSDIFIGNSNIFLFTWSGFLLPVIMGFLISGKMKKDQNNKVFKLFLFSELAGISSSLFFFIWTNFGHWLTTNMYSKDIEGLISCYINAIPFLKPQLSGNLIIVPLIVMITYIAFNYSTRKNQKLADIRI